MKTLTIELPDNLAEQLGSYVFEGWAASEEAVVTEALQRYLYSHSPELQEKFLRKDMALHVVSHD